MIRYLSILSMLVSVSLADSLAQISECRTKPKRFPSYFSQLTSDYVNLNLQADVLPKRYFQFESDFLFGALFRNRNGEKYYAYNSNLVRTGLGIRTELRLGFSIPGRNLQLNYPEIEELHSPLSIGLKMNLLAESSSMPGISVIAEYLYFNAMSHYRASLIFDKLAFRVLKLSLSAGPQLSNSGTSKFCYSLGLIMKDRNKKLGIYALASNRYAYLENIFNMGIVYSDNLNYQLTAGYGVHENEGLFMLSFSGLINYSNLQRRFGAYFSKRKMRVGK